MLGSSETGGESQKGTAKFDKTAEIYTYADYASGFVGVNQGLISHSANSINLTNTKKYTVESYEVNEQLKYLWTKWYLYARFM